MKIYLGIIDMNIYMNIEIDMDMKMDMSNQSFLCWISDICKIFNLISNIMSVSALFSPILIVPIWGSV
jgi:hypothetical protein